MQVAKLQKNYPRQIRNYAVFIFFTLLAAAAYGYLQYTKLSIARDTVGKAQILTESMRSSATGFGSAYAEMKRLFDKDFRTIADALQAVYPSEESYTSLTRLLDDFMQQNNRSFDPIFMNDLRFSQSRADTSGDYSLLPFTLTLSTTRSNFEKFLRFIENSGALADGSRQAGVRLMDLRSISINFARERSAFASGEAATSTAPLMNVSVVLNAYFQSPSEAFSPDQAVTPG